MKVRIRTVGIRLFPTRGLEGDKIYEAVKKTNYAFTIKTDEDTLLCLFRGCAHLGGGDWEVVEEE